MRICKGTLQFPSDASCVTEPETLERKHKVTEYLKSLIMSAFIDQCKMRRFKEMIKTSVLPSCFKLTRVNVVQVIDHRLDDTCDNHLEPLKSQNILLQIYLYSLLLFVPLKVATQLFLPCISKCCYCWRCCCMDRWIIPLHKQRFTKHFGHLVYNRNRSPVNFTFPG